MLHITNIKLKGKRLKSDKARDLIQKILEENDIEAKVLHH